MVVGRPFTTGRYELLFSIDVGSPIAGDSCCICDFNEQLAEGNHSKTLVMRVSFLGKFAKKQDSFCW